MKLRKLAVLATTAVLGTIGIGALMSPAPAADPTTTIDATISTSLTMSTVPASSVSWPLAATGANTASGGNMAVTANVAYTVSLSAAKTHLTEHNGTSYGTKALGSTTTVTPTSTGGTGVPTAQTTALGGVIATGVGGTTDSYSISLAQPTTIADKPLPAGSTYRNVLTYTLAQTL